MFVFSAKMGGTEVLSSTWGHRVLLCLTGASFYFPVWWCTFILYRNGIMCDWCLAGGNTSCVIFISPLTATTHLSAAFPPSRMQQAIMWLKLLFLTTMHFRSKFLEKPPSLKMLGTFWRNSTLMMLCSLTMSIKPHGAVFSIHWFCPQTPVAVFPIHKTNLLILQKRLLIWFQDMVSVSFLPGKKTHPLHWKPSFPESCRFCPTLRL